MIRQTMGFRHAVVDAHNGDLVAVMRSPDDAYDYCDYFATVRRDAAVLDLWAEILKHLACFNAFFGFITVRFFCCVVVH